MSTGKIRSAQQATVVPRTRTPDPATWRYSHPLYVNWRAVKALVCSRKKDYDTKEEAQIHITPELEQEGVRAYACEWCPKWHIGHYRTIRAEMEDDCRA